MMSTLFYVGFLQTRQKPASRDIIYADSRIDGTPIGSTQGLEAEHAARVDCSTAPSNIAGCIFTATAWHGKERLSTHRPLDGEATSSRIYEILAVGPDRIAHHRRHHDN